SRIVRATGNLAAASKQLGHSSIAITAKHYAHITPEDVHAANTRTAEVIRAKREALKAQNLKRISKPMERMRHRAV
ncbi:MAG: hypothetical protein M3158_10285, partial [Pseudomonadota bacterium]|nr:hypothetical protein [Pseudomonadota bacterium]